MPILKTPIRKRLKNKEANGFLIVDGVTIIIKENFGGKKSAKNVFWLLSNIIIKVSSLHQTNGPNSCFAYRPSYKGNNRGGKMFKGQVHLTVQRQEQDHAS